MSWKRTVLLATATVALGATAHGADRIVPPAVPVDIEVPAGFKPFFVSRAVGTQNFICAPANTATGVDWLFIGPQATGFDAEYEQILTHFQSKNPLRANALHATWQHSRDTSTVWATRVNGSLDPNFVAPGAIEWLLLERSGSQLGPTSGNKLAGTRFIHRVNTVGGAKPPAAECTPSTLNTRKLVYYEADYYFYQ
jgi:Protein of unknown function (DUF3455)